MLVGITTENYYEIPLDEDEKQNKTWIFLDEYKIEWGIFDEDFSNKEEADKMLKWCSGLLKDTIEYFAKFYQDCNSSRASHGSRESELKAKTITFGQELNSVVIVPSDS